MRTRFFAAALLAFTSTIACSKKTADFTVAHRYTLTGKVVSLNSKAQTASIDAAAIPNYMDAMRMDYPIKSKTDFDALHVGENIRATLNVSAGNEDYNLSNIQNRDSGQKQR